MTTSQTNDSVHRSRQLELHRKLDQYNEDFYA